MKKNKQFVFVVGVPRSGTTWLFNMLAEHPEFCSLNGANTLFQRYIFPMEQMYELEEVELKNKGFTRGMPSKLSHEEFHELLGQFADMFYSRLPDKDSLYVEKATDLLGETENILRFIPDAKFIHIVRDGRNAALSDIKLTQKYGLLGGIETVYDAAHRWKTDISAYRRHAAMIPEQMMEIKYEDLLVDTMQGMREIFGFIGCDSSHELTDRIVAEYGYKRKQVSTPTTQVADKQGNPLQPYHTEMSRLDQAIFEQIAGKLLLNYGYETSQPIKNRVSRFFFQYFKLYPYWARESGKPFRFILGRLRNKMKTSIK